MDKIKSKFNDRKKKVYNNFLWSLFYWIYIFLARMLIWAERSQRLFQLNWKPDLIIVNFIDQTSTWTWWIRAQFFTISSIYGSQKWMNVCMNEWTAKHLARDFPLLFLLMLNVNIQTEMEMVKLHPQHRRSTIQSVVKTIAGVRFTKAKMCWSMENKSWRLNTWNNEYLFILCTYTFILDKHCCICIDWFTCRLYRLLCAYGHFLHFYKMSSKDMLLLLAVLFVDKTFIQLGFFFFLFLYKQEKRLIKFE